MIKVTVTCAWCLTTKETSLQNPIPEGWIASEVQSPDVKLASVEENFCSSEHQDHYMHYAPMAHEAAAVDYTAKFYAEMNVLRAKEAKEPRPITKSGLMC